MSEQLAKLPSQLWRTGNDGFAEIAGAMDALAVQVDCARVGLVQEAETRGVVDQSPSPSATDWLLAHSLHLEPADAARTVDLARACSQPRNQVMAVAVAGCTFPGCGRPPQWCDAHHVKHWADGGPTALLNLAMPCAYHPPHRSAGGTPTHIHQHDLTATVTALDATWHT